MKLHCCELHAASDMSDEQVLADQQELPDFERVFFEVDGTLMRSSPTLMNPSWSM